MLKFPTLITAVVALITVLSPLYAAFLIPFWSLDPRFYQPFFELSLLVFLLFCFWALFRNRVVPKEKESVAKQPKEKSNLFFIVLGSLIILVFLQLLRLRTAIPLFYAILASMSFIGLSDAARYHRKYRLAFLFRLLYNFSLSYICIFIVTNEWLWQPIYFCLAIATNCTLPWVAYHLVQWLASNDTKKNKASLDNYPIAFFLRFYALLLVMSPCFLAILCYLDQLSLYYVFPFVTIPISIPLLESVRQAEKTAQIPRDVYPQTIRVSMLFVLLLILLKLLQ